MPISADIHTKKIKKKMSFIVFCIVFFANLGNSTKLTVSTFNLWNVMFSWDVRKVRIAEMITDSKSDMIIFQEVRSNYNEDRNQITELQSLVPEYKWAVYRTAATVNNKSKHNRRKAGWEKEGLGILSKRIINDVNVYQLPSMRGPDTNKRIALVTNVNLEDGTYINIIAVHFSYDRQQQCGNSKSILDLIHMKRLENVIILGDFNTYTNFESPINVFTNNINQTNPCFHHGQITQSKIKFQDVGQKTVPSNRLTFSNMPIPGYESRPDRILLSPNYHIEKSWLSGNGSYYQKHYYANILFDRLKTLLSKSYESLIGVTGYSCQHDCGPKGFCRCGNCVKGDNSDCDICSECDGLVFVIFLLFSTVLLVVLLVLFYSVLNILIIAAKYNQDNIYSILGFKCCLFNTELCKFKLFSRRNRHFRIVKILQFPPLYLFCSSVICVIFVLYIGRMVFYSSLENIFSVMEEELYPSDHLMLSTQLFF